MFREAIRIDCRARNNDPQFGSPIAQSLEVSKQEIDIQRSLMCLVHNDGIVGLQILIPLCLGKQYPVRHELDERGVFCLVGKTNFESDRVANRGL